MVAIGGPFSPKGKVSTEPGQHHSDGTYAHVFDIGKDPKTGKRRRRWVTGKTLSELRRNVADVKARGGGGVTEKVKGTFGEWVTAWLDDLKTSGRLSPNSWILYESSWRLYVQSVLSNVRLDDLDVEHIERLYAHMLSAGASGNVRNRVGRVMHRAIAVAIKRRRYSRPNPFGLVDRARVIVKDRPMLEPEQARDLLDAARGERFEALWALLLTGGLRLGEALALEWSDVDLERRMVSIRRSLHEVHGNVEFGATKTAKSRRQVTLGVLATDLLKVRKLAANAEKHGSPLIFPTSVGTPMRRGNLLRSHFRPLLKRAGLAGYRMHDLRHASASLALLSGAPAKAVAERLGHSTTRLTLDRYSHVLSELQRGTADAIDSVLTMKPGKRNPP